MIDKLSGVAGVGVSGSGWGWDPVARQSCSPVAVDRSCDYSSAAVNDGWGWDASSQREASARHIENPATSQWIHGSAGWWPSQLKRARREALGRIAFECRITNCFDQWPVVLGALDEAGYVA